MVRINKTTKTTQPVRECKMNKNPESQITVAEKMILYFGLLLVKRSKYNTEKMEMLIRRANRICEIFPDNWFISEISLPVIPVSKTMPYKVFRINEPVNTSIMIFSCLNFNFPDPAITIGNNKRGSLIFKSLRPFLKSML